MDLVYHQSFRVPSYDVGPHGDVEPATLMGFLQEAAGAHAGRFKLSVLDLQQRGLTWVLSRYHLRLSRNPRFGEPLEVTTWPSGVSRMFVTRDFEVRAADGSAVALATTSWVIIDMAEKKPVPAATAVPADYAVPRRVLGDEFASLPVGGQHERETTVPVMWRDLDLNDHVNHTVYVQWALEALPREVLRSMRASEIEVAYRAEARDGDVVAARVETIDGGDTVFAHRIVNTTTNVELARLRTRWVPR